METTVRSTFDEAGPQREGGTNLSFVLEWLDRFLSNLWWLGIGKLEIVYRADFVVGKVLKNDIHAPPLWAGAIPIANQNPVPPPGQVTLGSGGLLLGITKSATDGRTAVVVGLSPKPAELRRFRMVANFSLPEGLEPSHKGNQWAALLVARNGDREALPDEPVFIGATHQVRGGVPPIASGASIALGVAGADSSSGPQIVDGRLVYPEGLPMEFQLQTDVDCDGGEGRSRLFTPYHRLEWRERPWTSPAGFDMGSDMTSIGLGIGMPKTSSGRPTVVVKDFEIYKYVPQRWWLRGVAAAARVGRLALSVALRRRPEHGGA